MMLYLPNAPLNAMNKNNTNVVIKYSNKQYKERFCFCK